MAAPPSWHVLFLSHTAQGGAFRVGSHHLARELARAGHPVTHLTTPVTLAHVARLLRRDTRSRLRLAVGGHDDAAGVHHRVALAPAPLRWQTPAALAAASEGAARRLLARQLRHRPPVDVAVVDQPLFAGLLDAVGARRVVYRATDLYPEGPLRAAERRLLGRADGVVATSRAVLDELAPSLPRPVPSLVLENGVEWQRFAGARAARRDGVVYVGAMDHRFDWTAVRLMATAHPDVTVTLLGPPAATPPAGLPPNVHLGGPVDYGALPEALAGARVGLLPLSDDPANAGRSPMKYFEYLAAGASVVGRRTPTLAAQRAPGVFLYDTPEEAAAQLGEALGAPAPNAAGRSFAQRFDWPERARRLEAFLGALGRSGPGARSD